MVARGRGLQRSGCLDRIHSGRRPTRSGPKGREIGCDYSHTGDVRPGYPEYTTKSFMDSLNGLVHIAHTMRAKI